MTKTDNEHLYRSILQVRNSPYGPPVNGGLCSVKTWFALSAPTRPLRSFPCGCFTRRQRQRRLRGEGLGHNASIRQAPTEGIHGALTKRSAEPPETPRGAKLLTRTEIPSVRRPQESVSAAVARSHASVTESPSMSRPTRLRCPSGPGGRSRESRRADSSAWPPPSGAHLHG